MALLTLPLAAFGLTACQPESTLSSPPEVTGALEMFDDCDEAFSELTSTAAKYVGPYGFGPGVSRFDATDSDAAEAAPGEDKAVTDPQAEEEYSGTNVQEQGIDEPDLVKTDGSRLVVLADGRLHVVDADSRERTGSVVLDDEADTNYAADPVMLWHGDRVLVIRPQPVAILPVDREPGPGQQEMRVALVDISGSEPTIESTYTIEGAYVDARSIDGIVRIVVRSAPQIDFRQLDGVDAEEATAANRQIIADSQIENWLPRYRVDGVDGQVPCESIAHPAAYSATSMLTVLSFDIAEPLDDGAPVSIAADGDTVYGSGNALYIANDRAGFATFDTLVPVKSETEIYRFAVDGRNAPKYHSSATVPGFLLNRYALSEWDSHLRVATTTEATFSTESDEATESQSAVYALRIDDDAMTEVGRVEGLGVSERIYAVRYVGATAYVVTFRQTDPLYVLDLSDPAAPTMTGELKIPGYSAYLHPIAEDLLLGVGRDADENGNISGMQVSLFDVSDPSAPERVDQYTVPGASSSAEFDPHAFLYWPDTRLAVVPVTGDEAPGARALLLTVGDDKLTKVAEVRHEKADDPIGVQRAVIIGDTLWTVSPSGMVATSLDDYDEIEWVDFDDA